MSKNDVLSKVVKMRMKTIIIYSGDDILHYPCENSRIIRLTEDTEQHKINIVEYFDAISEHLSCNERHIIKSIMYGTFDKKAPLHFEVDNALEPLSIVSACLGHNGSNVSLISMSSPQSIREIDIENYIEVNEVSIRNYETTDDGIVFICGNGYITKKDLQNELTKRDRMVITPRKHVHITILDKTEYIKDSFGSRDLLSCPTLSYGYDAYTGELVWWYEGGISFENYFTSSGEGLHYYVTKRRGAESMSVSIMKAIDTIVRTSEQEVDKRWRWNHTRWDGKPDSVGEPLLNKVCRQLANGDGIDTGFGYNAYAKSMKTFFEVLDSARVTALKSTHAVEKPKQKGVK